MDTDELDVAIEELENRLERLRALYEQYFLGIEKIEPTVARKDVDRRIWLLRREQIRNTAKRFKLQTVIQRYNTFQQYWGRICREIENGTYKRHLIRAEKNQGVELLTIAARKRLGRRRKLGVDDEKPADPTWEVERELGEALDNPDWKPLEDAKRAVDEVLGRDSLAAPPKEPAAPRSAPASAPTRARARPVEDLGRLDLEMDFFDAPTRPAKTQPGVAPKPPAAAQPAGAPKPPAAAQPGGAPRPRPAALAAARAAAAGKPLPASSSPPPVPAGATPPSAPARPPSPAARPGALPSARSAPPPLQRPATAAGHPPAAAPTLPRPPGQARPAPPRREAAPAPAAPMRAAGGGEDPRVKDLHARLVEAKRRTNDTREVSVDGLRKSLEAAESRLRKQHGNRKIDFDVVIKDGKAVVKPILR